MLGKDYVEERAVVHGMEVTESKCINGINESLLSFKKKIFRYFM